MPAPLGGPVILPFGPVRHASFDGVIKALSDPRESMGGLGFPVTRRKGADEVDFGGRRDEVERAPSHTLHLSRNPGGVCCYDDAVPAAEAWLASGAHVTAEVRRDAGRSGGKVRSIPARVADT